MGHTLIKHYKKIIKINAINNCPVTMKDINICEKIFYPYIYTLRGKLLFTKPKAALNDYIDIPKELKNTHQNIELCANIMYISGQMFFVAIYKRIKFITIQ